MTHHIVYPKIGGQRAGSAARARGESPIQRCPRYSGHVSTLDSMTAPLRHRQTSSRAVRIAPSIKARLRGLAPVRETSDWRAAISYGMPNMRSEMALSGVGRRVRGARPRHFVHNAPPSAVHTALQSIRARGAAGRSMEYRRDRRVTRAGLPCT